MKTYQKISILCTLLTLVGIACVDPYAINIQSSRGYLVVEGLVSTGEEPGNIFLGRTDPEASFVSTEFSKTIITRSRELLPEEGAEVSLIVNGENEIPLFESTPGLFQYPQGFKGQIGTTYKLRILTRDGRVYSTKGEEVKPVPKIERAYEEFDREGNGVLTAGGVKLSGNNVFIDFNDPENERNFYRWNWTSWELKEYCATCNQGKYYPYEIEEGVEVGDCFRELTLNPNTVYDYVCLTSAWQIFRNSEINIFDDRFTNGQPQKAKQVAHIPLYQSNPCLVSIEQSSLTADAYRYFKLLQDQAVNTGTLADTPPAPIQGNVFNESDPSELVLGYFVTSDIAEERFMLNRRNTQGGIINGLFKVQFNRDPSLENPSPERPEVPLAFCKETRTSTGIMPRGWRFGRD